MLGRRARRTFDGLAYLGLVTAVSGAQGKDLCCMAFRSGTGPQASGAATRFLHLLGLLAGFMSLTSCDATATGLILGGWRCWSHRAIAFLWCAALADADRSVVVCIASMFQVSTPAFPGIAATGPPPTIGTDPDDDLVLAFNSTACWLTRRTSRQAARGLILRVGRVTTPPDLNPAR